MLIITSQNAHSWIPTPGMTQLVVNPDALLEGELPDFLNRMGDQLSLLPYEDIRLEFKKPLTDAELKQLAIYIKKYSDTLAIGVLKLAINENTLQSANFNLVLKTLNTSSVQRLELNIEQAITAGKQAVSDGLLACAQGVHYSIVPYGDARVPAELKIASFKKFKETILKNSQNYNLAKLKARINHETWLQDDDADLNLELDHDEINDPNAKKIKMKVLIHSGRRNTEFDHKLRLDVNFVDVEQQQQQEQVVELVIENQDEQQQEQAVYSGAVIGYEEYRSFQDHCPLLLSELFGNMPHALKFMTPVAYAALKNKPELLGLINPDKPTKHFIVKKRPSGELVLDYDLYSEQQKQDFYTPKETHRITPSVPVSYFVTSQNFDLTHMRNFAEVKRRAYGLLNNYQNYYNKYASLYIKYDCKGAEIFNDALIRCDQYQRGLLPFLFQHYLLCLNDWSYLLDNNDFIQSLEQIQKYDKTKLTCLKKFLERTGRSQHELKTTLTAFEDFWEQWFDMAAKNKLDPNAINTNWSTPEGGNPIVYMERLLTLLKNARDLKEQCEYLDGIVLDNYGAYYASKYEGFKLVSKEMGFNYNPEEQHRIPYNPQANVYRVNLTDLCEHVRGPIGAYYANDTEGWVLIDSTEERIERNEYNRLVSKGKAIPYTDIDFEPPFKIYDLVSWQDTLYKYFYKRPLPAEKIFELSCRVLGRQSESIELKTLSEALVPLQEFFQKCERICRTLDKLGNSSNKVPDYEKERSYSKAAIAKTTVLSLFALANNRNCDKAKLKLLLQTIYNFDGSGRSVYNQADALGEILAKLYNIDVHLNADEMLTILRGCMRESENFGEQAGALIERSLGRKSVKIVHDYAAEYLNKLFKHLRDNKYAALKLLKYSGVRRNLDFKMHKDDLGLTECFSCNYADAVDKAEYLALIDSENKAEAHAKIAEFYRDDLLLFSGMIHIDDVVYSEDVFNYKDFEMSFHKSRSYTEGAHLPYHLFLMKEVKRYFIKAANLPKPNNLHTALTILFNAKQPFGYKMFFEAFSKIQDLPEVDIKAVERILKQHKFKLSYDAPEIFLRDSESIRPILIDAISLLKSMSAQDRSFDHRREMDRLAQLNTLQLQAELKNTWPLAGPFLMALGNFAFAPLFMRLKTHFVDEVLSSL